MRRRMLVWAVGLLVLAGCSDPGQPSTTLPSQPAPTSAVPTAPTLEPLGPADFPVPDAARVQTLDGAVVAMATYYFDLINYARSATSTDWLRQLASGCDTCDAIADTVDNDRVVGNSWSGGEFGAYSIGGQLTTDTSADLAYAVDQAALEIVGPDGAVVADGTSPAGRLSGGGLLTWDSLRQVWVTNQVELERLP